MIGSGSILMQGDSPHPLCFQIEDDECPSAWAPVRIDLTPHQLEAELSAAGWTFFFMGAAIRATAFGFSRARRLRAALKGVIAEVKEQRCNCLEVISVGERSFLGIPYLSVSAHARHIQKGMVFSCK